MDTSLWTLHRSLGKMLELISFNSFFGGLFSYFFKCIEEEVHNELFRFVGDTNLFQVLNR